MPTINSYSNARVYTLKPMQWSDSDIPLLGATILNQELQSNCGYDKIFNKISIVTEQRQN